MRSQALRQIARVGLTAFAFMAGCGARAPTPVQSAAPVQVAPPDAGVSEASIDGGVERRSALRIWWDHTTPVPIVFYTPENQIGLGGGLMTTWLFAGAWADRPSNVIAYGIYTTRKQIITGASYELHFADDRYVLTQEFRFIDWPDRFYGVGNDTREKDRENYTDHYSQLESEFVARLWSRLYLGLRHQFRASDAQDLPRTGVLSEERPLGVGTVFWSGVGPVLLWDTRKGLFWPSGGSLIRADATLYRHFLGADFNASLLRLDARRYQPTFLDHVLALRLVFSGVLGNPPFQALPALGGNALFRGWFLGRLRDRVLLAAEAEYRVPLAERWAVVAFGSVGRVAPRVGELSFGGLRGAGGAGVRFAVRKESRANFRLDLAYGDEFSVYFQFREAY